MYWLISLPLIDESYDRTWLTLKQKTAQEIEWSSNYRQALFDSPSQAGCQVSRENMRGFQAYLLSDCSVSTHLELHMIELRYPDGQI